MFVQKWAFIISIALIFAGCADLKKSEQEERIDVMEKQLSEWETELNSFDSEQWEEWTNSSIETVSKLKGLESDTVSLEHALAMDEYHQMASKLPGLGKDLNSCLQEIESIKERLKKLRSDIQKGSGQRHKYNKYLKSEEEELKMLKLRFDLFMSAYEEIKTDFPVTQEEVNAIIAERNLAEEVQ